MKRIVNWWSVFKVWDDFKTRTLLAVALLMAAERAEAVPNVFIGEANVSESSLLTISGMQQLDRAYRASLSYWQIVIESADYHYRAGELHLKVLSKTVYGRANDDAPYKAVYSQMTFHFPVKRRFDYSVTNDVSKYGPTYWPYRGVGTRIALPPGGKTVNSQSIQSLVLDGTSENVRYRVVPNMRAMDGTAFDFTTLYVKGEEVSFNPITIEAINRLRVQPTPFAELISSTIFRDEP